jgi:CspA family cold shock protein
MLNGRVKFFNAARAYGFIERDDGEDDMFVHLTAVESGHLLAQDERVEFEVGTNSRNGKLQAVNVRVVG